MRTKIRKTSKRILKDGEWKYLYTCNAFGKVFFKYAYTDEEARIKFENQFGVIKRPVLETAYPSLDILLNNEFILIN